MASNAAGSQDVLAFLQQKMAALEAATGALKQDNDMLKQTCNQLQQENVGLNQQVAQLVGEMGDAKAKIKEQGEVQLREMKRWSLVISSYNQDYRVTKEDIIKSLMWVEGVKETDIVGVFQIGNTECWRIRFHDTRLPRMVMQHAKQFKMAGWNIQYDKTHDMRAVQNQQIQELSKVCGDGQTPADRTVFSMGQGSSIRVRVGKEFKDFDTAMQQLRTEPNS